MADATLEAGDCVEIKGETTESGDEDLIHWKAQILEVRAVDENHVYLRIVWLYRPQDLPDGPKKYHGIYELVPSNYLQVVNAMTVNKKIIVQRWDENQEDEPPGDDGEYYWRQTFDALTNTASVRSLRYVITQQRINITL